MDNERWRSINIERWDGIASRWRSFGLPAADVIHTFMEDLACKPGSSVLDLGCGAGLVSVALAREGYRVYGIDISPRMIEQALQLAAEHQITSRVISFDVGNVEHIALGDTAVDAILCRNVLDFVPSPGTALSEIGRVLKPGGRLVLSVLGAHSPVKEDSWRRLLPGAEITGLNYMAPWEMEALLDAFGWEIILQRPTFAAAASGATNKFTLEDAARWDKILQQAAATGWTFVAVKPLERV